MYRLLLARFFLLLLQAQQFETLEQRQAGTDHLRLLLLLMNNTH